MSNPGDTPLHWAILKQNEKAVKKLLEEGADLMAENDNHQNLLRVAVDLSGYNLIEINLLIEHISEDNITEEAYLKFLNDLVDDRQNIHAQNLLKRCLTFSYINKSYPTRPSNCLWAAVRIDPFCDVVKNMLKRGVNINYSHGDDGDYRTALHIACECDNSSMGELLLKNGAAASFNDRWPFNNINLCLNLYKSAVATRHNEIIVALLDRGIDVNSRLPGSTCSLLHRAVEVNNKKIVELLISKGAYVNIEGYLGQQPISRCFKREHSSIFDIFVGNKNLSFNSETLYILTRYFPADFLERIKPLLEKVKQCGFPEKKYDLFKDFRDCYDFVKFVIENTTFRKKFGNHLGKLFEYALQVNIRTKNGWSVIYIHFSSTCRYEYLSSIYGTKINIKCYKGVTPFDCLFEREFSPERVRNHWNFYEFIELISQHMFKMRLLNQFVNEKDYQKVMEVAINPYRYEEKYKKEIEKMKATVINNNVTYYDIVRADLYELVNYLKDSIIFKTLKSGNYKSEFPEFKIFISDCFSRAYNREELLDKISCYTIFDIIYKFPYPCMRSIMENFSNQDLRNFIY